MQGTVVNHHLRKNRECLFTVLLLLAKSADPAFRPYLKDLRIYQSAVGCLEPILDI